MSNTKKIVFIVGPTSVGKSRLAIGLALAIKGEIISCDSMQIYKDINILNAKPSLSDRKKVPHHLLDVISVKEEFDVAKYRFLAVKIIEDIHFRGYIPIVTGGSGMYIQVLLDGIFKGKNKNIELRKSLREQLIERGNQFLYNQLRQKDPNSAKRIHPNDIKRIIRALEVCIVENSPMSMIQKNRSGLWGKYDIKIFCLNMKRENLYHNINNRVDEMFKLGAVDETRSVYDKKLSISAERIIGLKEISAYIDNKYSLEDAKEKLKMNTRRYAKRQLTWFKKDKRLEWIDVTDKKDDVLINIMKDKIYE